MGAADGQTGEVCGRDEQIKKRKREMKYEKTVTLKNGKESLLAVQRGQMLHGSMMTLIRRMERRIIC
jgi:hypothetical protein